jgi:very-short-patch-repair endonuclease
MEIKPFDESTMAERLALIAKFDALPERVRQYAWDDSKDLYIPLGYGLLRFVWGVSTTISCIEKCESPIEQLMALALDFHLHHRVRRGVFATYFHQRQIEVGNNKYRVDFSIQYCLNPTSDDMVFKSFVVECDGHDFHEKTKQQAAKDKKRDRDLQSAGYSILRFTGSEIYKDPTACVQEIADYINNLAG